MEDSTNVENDLEMRPSGRNEGPTVVVVEKSYKSSSYDDGEEHREQVEDHLVANEDVIIIFAENDGHIERLGKGGRYFMRKQHLRGGGKWVFRTNRNISGEIVRYKAR